MSKQVNKNLAAFIPMRNQPSFAEINPTSLEDFSSSSLLRLTEPLSANTLSSSHKHQYSFPVSQTPSLNASRRNDSNNSKRLKLKDYLHLNSIEKKSKKSNSFSKIQSEPSIDLNSKRTILSQFNSQSLKPTPLQVSIFTEPSSSRQLVDTTEILKEDIAKRIEKQIKELNHLAQYVKKDFKTYDNEAQSQYMLFSILNAVLNGSKTYDVIGEQIIEYDKEEGSRKSRNTSKEYFWNDGSKELESPARILKKGLDLTFNLAQFLIKKK